VTSKMYCDY